MTFQSIRNWHFQPIQYHKSTRADNPGQPTGDHRASHRSPTGGHRGGVDTFCGGHGWTTSGHLWVHPWPPQNGLLLEKPQE